MSYSIMEIQEMLKEKQSGSRFVHTLGVQYTSAALAMCHGADMHKAELAGLLHDCAKHMHPEKLLKKSRKHGLEVTPAQEKNPFLLHGRVGAYLAREKYGISDEEILGAIEWHTTGKPAMTLLEKIVFTADYIEPGRTKAPNLAEIRRISFEDIDLAVYRILAQTLDYLDDDKQDIDDASVITYSYYEKLLRQEGKL